MEREQIVYTLTAKCRDCYRCLKACPVKAIKMKNGQAYVDEERCIACGTCIRECPQEAKVYRRDIEKVRTLIKQAAYCAVTLAPSHRAFYAPGERGRLVGALRALGFSFVSETAVGAFDVAMATKRVLKTEEPNICTACPVVVNYAEKYLPEALPLLLPLHSPMVVHGMRLKKDREQDVAVVFIGPCIAKKREAEREDTRGSIDGVLTFTELEEWLDQEGIKLENCEESGFDEIPPAGAPLFPIPGGLTETAGIKDDELEILQPTGFPALREVLAYALAKKSGMLIEPLFCDGGCINGPGVAEKENIFIRRQALLSAYRQTVFPQFQEALEPSEMGCRFNEKEQIPVPAYTEQDIRQVLARTGKETPDKELNCGACGYPSCREKAVAVLEGMAEVEMCLPYMRRLAEQRTDKIIDTSPNGFVILDSRFSIMKMNRTFKAMFRCTDGAQGKNISRIMDPGPFEKIATGNHGKLEQTVTYKDLGLICHELFYELKEEKQYVGIFVDVTNLKRKDTTLRNIKAQTILQARELLEHQIEMAQQIAGYLGKNTARSEELVNKLMYLSGETDEV